MFLLDAFKYVRKSPEDALSATAFGVQPIRKDKRNLFF